MKRIIPIIITLFAATLFAFSQNSTDRRNTNITKESADITQNTFYVVVSDSTNLAFNFNKPSSIDNYSYSYKNESEQNTNQSSQKNLFEKLANNKSITTVYISKAMLSMASGFAPNMGNIKAKDISKKMDQIEIYSSENKAGCREIANETSKLSNNKNYEQLMRIKDGFDDVTFYGVKNGDAFKEMIMITMDGESECTVIRTIGNFTAEDIKKVAGR